MSKTGTSSSNSVLITAIVCGTVIVLAVAAFLFFVITHKDSPDQQPVDDDNETEMVEETAAYPGDKNNTDSRFHNFDWLSESKLTIADISGLSGGDLRLLRNAIFAKHGYRFRSSDLTQYFSRFDWYIPSRNDVSSLLSPVETYNVNFIQKYEGKGTKNVSAPSRVSNVSFANDYSDIVCYTRLSDADVAGLTKAEIRILRNTIYARHGRSFKSADLNNYFRGFSWYNPYRTEVPPAELSSVEKHNIALLSKYE